MNEHKNLRRTSIRIPSERSAQILLNRLGNPRNARESLEFFAQLGAESMINTIFKIENRSESS
jgi:hypothetical protein